MPAAAMVAPAMPRAATVIAVLSPVATRAASDFFAGVAFSTVLVVTVVLVGVAAGLVSGFVSGFASVLAPGDFSR